MVQAPANERIRQRGDNMRLPHHFGKTFGAVFTGKDKDAA